MDKKEFCECLLEDRYNMGVLQTYIVTEKAYKLAKQLQSDNDNCGYDTIMDLLNLFEKCCA